MATGEELRAQYEELVQSEKQIRDSDSRLRYLIGFYEQANKDEKELLRYAVEGAGVVTNSPLGYLAFLNEDESELSMYAWSENAMSECTMREKPIVYKTEHTGLWGETVRQRRPVITNDYQAPDAKKKGYPKGHPHIVRHMGVPVIDEGHIKLTAGVANKPSDYTEYDANELALLMQGLWQVIKRKRAEESLQESETKFREIFDNVNDAVHLHEINEQGIPGKFIDMNAVACRMVQYTKDEMLQKGPLDITTDYHSIPLPQIEEELKVRGQVIFDTEHKRKDGHIIPVEINSHVVVIHGRKMVLSVVRDISERKKTEEAIRQANRKLNLLSSITRHDVANQLTVVQGYAQLALAKESEPAVAEYLEKIERAVSLIQDQFEFTRTYQELGMHAPAWHRIYRVIQDTPKQGLTITCTCDEWEIFADPMIGMVFSNLFDNAVRHGETVTDITISCRGQRVRIWSS